MYDREKEKFIIRYYQLEAIRKINLKESSLAGVIQHATGSGKSFLMVCFINYLKNKKSNYCYLFVADRLNLVKQFFDNFQNFASSAQFNLIEEKSIIKEGKLLSIIGRKQAANSIFFITIQKFGQEEPQGFICPNNFLVIVDEAHRSQHGEFAQTMRNLLPHAIFLGLTATPLTKKGKSTAQAFGEKEYIFTSSQSVEEGFTVPLFYRLIMDQAILTNASLKEQYQKIIDENQDKEEKEVKNALNKQIKLETLISNPKRLDWIVQKFFEIYQTMKEETQEEIFKVMFICYSSIVIEKLYDRMNKISPHVVPIISPNEKLNPEIKKIVDKNRENIAIFRDSRNKTYQIALALEMLNVGFDMPCLQTVFIDTPKTEDHDIFQTISRPNRQFSGKTHGTIVDFLGLKDKIIGAVKKYDAQGLLILDQEVERKVKENIEKLQIIYDDLGKNINITLVKDLKSEPSFLLIIADKLRINEKQ
ncbi:MAG: DEAD/DEAH box helicase family protein [Mollicutes bacterium UO1]